MNKLTVRQRKIAYFIGIGLLLIPIVLLGAPADPESRLQSFLASQRDKYDLGEASLGNVDPTSATMNLVLLGMRGVAASVLWQQADDYKAKKKFTELEDTVESIILLQPHFKGVWRFQAWNLAYNVSAECDNVADRFFWVKRGTKFMNRGVDRNQMVPELYFDMGRLVGEKIGNADEREQFRRFFRKDPDEERWKGGPDEDINPNNEDNFLVSRGWYNRANDTLKHEGVEQHGIDTSLFLAYPQRALMQYARALQKDGLQGDVASMTKEERDQAYQDWAESAQDAWSKAYDEWVNIYGRTKIPTSAGGHIVLENDEAGLADLAQLAEQEGFSLQEKMDWQERYRSMTAYPYWKRHCDIEKRENMAQARYLLAEGRRLYREVQDLEGARAYMEEGMAKLDDVVQKYQVTETSNVLINDEEEIVEDAMKAILIWQQVLRLSNEPIPETFPLQQIWDDPNRQAVRADLTERFRKWSGE